MSDTETIVFQDKTLAICEKDLQTAYSGMWTGIYGLLISAIFDWIPIIAFGKVANADILVFMSRGRQAIACIKYW